MFTFIYTNTFIYICNFNIVKNNIFFNNSKQKKAATEKNQLLLHNYIIYTVLYSHTIQFKWKFLLYINIINIVKTNIFFNKKPIFYYY